MWPIIVGFIVVVIISLIGFTKLYPLIGYGIAGMVTTGITIEWVNGCRSRRLAFRESYPLTFVKLLMANRPRYGGYIVHLAVVMVLLGVLGASFFNIQKDVVLAQGESVDVSNYAVKYVGTNVVSRSDRVSYLTDVEVSRDGQFFKNMTSRRDFYPSFNMASTRAAIHSTPIEDFYIVPSENMADGSVGISI